MSRLQPLAGEAYGKSSCMNLASDALHERLHFQDSVSKLNLDAPDYTRLHLQASV